MEVIQLTLQPDESIAFMLDIHADSVSPSSRIDDIQETILEKLESVRESCKSHKVKHLFLAGDIHNRVATTHNVVNQLGAEFLKFKQDGVELYSILGNHDIVRNSLEAIDCVFFTDRKYKGRCALYPKRRFICWRRVL